MNVPAFLRLAYSLPVLALALAVSGEAAPFHCISQASQCVVNGSQFTVVATTTGAGAGQMGFRFNNATGGAASGIAEIYFENGWDTYFTTPITFGGIVSVNGVSFSAGANPASLPDENQAIPPFSTSTILKADTVGAQANTINPGEQLIVYLTFKAGQSLTVAQTNSLMSTSATRIGLHVRGMAGGQSAAYVTPEPQTYSLLAALGCLGLILVHRRRKVTVS